MLVHIFTKGGLVMENKICPLKNQMCNPNCAWYIPTQPYHCAVAKLAVKVEEISKNTK